MPPSSASKTRRSDAVFRALRDEIGSGTPAVGGRLPSEQSLAERFGTSRVVVREALAALRSLGMVASRRGSGAYVTADHAARQTPSLDPATQTEILECLELRTALESEAAALAASRRAPQDLDVLRGRLSEMRERIAASHPTSDVDWSFHLAVARAARNGYFLRLLQGIGENAIPRARIGAEDETAPDREIQLLDEHFAVYQAIEAGEAEAARQAMRTHLENALKRYRARQVADWNAEKMIDI